MMDDNSTPVPSVFSYFKARIKELEEQGHQGTALTYQSTLRSLRRFRRNHDIPFEIVDVFFIDTYDRWLQRRGLKRNTISFYMRVFRALLNRAADEDLYCPLEPVNRIFRHVYTGVDRTMKRATQVPILEELLRLDLGCHHTLAPLAVARDIFFFSFYTRGMAFVDIAFLRRDCIHGTFITYTRHKTKQKLSITIEPCIRRILNRYYYRPNSGGYIFPILQSTVPDRAYAEYRNALSAYNRSLARLRTMLSLRVGVELPALTSYVARHTWATLAHGVDVPIHVISQSLGHANERTTQIYLDQLSRDTIDTANQRVLSLINPD